MTILTSADAVQSASDDWKRQGNSVGVVPTMGALHRGHMDLISKALDRVDKVIVSVFVNPTQFAPGEDFDRYPRDFDNDALLIEEAGGVAAIFAPSEEEMYPETPILTSVRVDKLDKNLCGPFRPGHFDGVATIVARLLNICRPDVAFFGMKDAQQLAIIRKLVADLNFGIDIVGVPTVREPDGLALSSRNAYLSSDEREQAVILSRAVARAGELIRAGERTSAVIETEMLTMLESVPLARVQYAEVVDGIELQRHQILPPRKPAIAATAVYFGTTRLIDNCFVDEVPA